MDTVFLLRLVYITFIIVDVIFGLILTVFSIKWKNTRFLPVLLICLTLSTYHVLSAIFYTGVDLSDEQLMPILLVSCYCTTLVNVEFLIYFSLSRKKALIYAIIFATIFSLYSFWLIFLSSKGTFMADIMRGRFNVYVTADNIWLVIFFAINIACYISTAIVLYTNLKRSRNKRRSIAEGILFDGAVIAGAGTLIINIISILYESTILAWLEPLFFSEFMVTIYIAEIFYSDSIISAAWLRRFSRILAIVVATLFYIYIASLIIDGIFLHNGTNFENIVFTNFVIVVLLLILLPILNAILHRIDKVILETTLDIVFIRQRLHRSKNKFLGSYVNLSSVLRMLLGVSFCGFIINEKLYSSPRTFLSSWYIRRVLKISNGKLSKIKRELSGYIGAKNIFEIKELRNNSGILIGYVIIGQRINDAGKNLNFRERIDVLLPEVANIVSDSF